MVNRCQLLISNSTCATTQRLQQQPASQQQPQQRQQRAVHAAVRRPPGALGRKRRDWGAHAGVARAFCTGVGVADGPEGGSDAHGLDRGGRGHVERRRHFERRRRPGRPAPGRAAQVEPIKPTLKLPGTKRLKLECDEPISKFALKFNLRRYNPASGSKTPLTDSIRQMTATAGGISFAKLQASVQEAAVRRRSSAVGLGPGAGGVSPELAALRKSLATLGDGSAQKSSALKTAAAPPPAAVSSSSRSLHAAPVTAPTTAARAVAHHAAAPSAAPSAAAVPSAASPGGRVLAGVLSMTAQMTVADSTPSPPPRLKRSRVGAGAGAGAGTPKAVTFAFGADAENAPPPPPSSSFSGLSKVGRFRLTL
jgi:hypothetical protein